VLVPHPIQIRPVEVRELVHQRFEVCAAGGGMPGGFRRPRVEQDEVDQHQQRPLPRAEKPRKAPAMGGNGVRHGLLGVHVHQQWCQPVRAVRPIRSGHPAETGDGVTEHRFLEGN